MGKFRKSIHAHEKTKKPVDSLGLTKKPISKRKSKILEKKKRKEELLSKIKTKQKELKTKSAALSIGELLNPLDKINEEIALEQEAKSRAAEGKKSSRKPATRRRDVMQEEMEQFRNVSNHPVFQSDPFGTLSQHLNNRLALLEKSQKAAPQKKKKNSSGSSKSKNNNMNTDNSKNQKKNNTKKKKKR